MSRGPEMFTVRENVWLYVTWFELLVLKGIASRHMRAA
jgi:hypothetical protein